MYSSYFSGNHEWLAVLPTSVFEAISPVSTHGLALVGIIAGVALGVWVLWLSVVRICKLKANIDRTSESAPLINPDLRTDLQRHHTVTASGSDTLLCSICANLDFYQIFLDGIPETEKIPLGSLSTILERSYQCSFCRLISFHFSHVDLSGIECGMFSMNCGCLREPFYRPKFHCYRLHMIIMKDPDHLLEKYPAFGAAGLPTIHLMQEDAFKFGRPPDLHGRRKWIKLCQEKHGDVCTGNVWRTDRKLPGFVRVVDVVSMAVVPAPSGRRYVSLSYVWGGIGTEYWTTKDNITERSKPGGLNTANLPDTITDSILFVRQLGERYIWIDALCIIQDDLKDKSTQLHAMDSVYGLSHLTIIAAGSTTARDPLPGCRPRTRTLQQHIEVVQGLHLCVAPPRLREAITLSAWNTRCWTCQESVLSRRRIYFTGQQVYFDCRRDTFCEDIIAESEHPRSRSFLQLSSGQTFPTLHSFESYVWAVEACTRRSLTIESDIVDALTGVTNALAIAFGLGDPARAFQYGMMLTDLHHALLWQHDPYTPRARRAPPDGGSSPWSSWAWATWRGAVIYKAADVNYSGEPTVKEPFVDPWYILDVRRAPRSAYSSPRGILDPTELTLDIHRPLKPGTLIFRTTSCQFGIARRGDEESSECVHYGHFNIFSTTSSPPTWVGSTILPLCPPPPTCLEFIVLSRDPDKFIYYHECLLNVMAVSQNEGLMERVGLGVIHEAAWIASRPEEKVVFLR
ncbi:heterokaryon incompatibility protein-domain-containing protein [Suillus paluster]|uniref:heterokaryon incompatibility protein-domain-containing protein n=1 Tax=Suillus paluster TaxID=48578 RepID=UPI001B86E735|nr:heterokaryon incompatibility protein-domain-containing protein [Suillus paluster]KAG1742781.1 heterokaryon incompatibility protein-domain-containing protein [Suillus paluster]